MAIEWERKQDKVNSADSAFIFTPVHGHPDSGKYKYN